MRLTRKRVLGILALASFCSLCVTFISLLVSGFPNRLNLKYVYFLYVVSAFVFFHSLFFYANLRLFEINGRGLSRNVPRYIDYLITGLLAVGLFQIYVSEEFFLRYIEKVAGSKAEVVALIRGLAADQVKNECVPREGLIVDLCKRLGAKDCERNPYFPDGYCKRLGEIAWSKSLDEYISSVLSKDSDFLNHKIRYVYANHGVVGVESPIAEYVRQYIALSEYGYVQIKNSNNEKLALNWVALVLLPLILALRVTKTSLELFVDFR